MASPKTNPYLAILYGKPSLSHQNGQKGTRYLLDDECRSLEERRAIQRALTQEKQAQRKEAARQEREIQRQIKRLQKENQVVPTQNETIVQICNDILRSLQRATANRMRFKHIKMRYSQQLKLFENAVQLLIQKELIHDEWVAGHKNRESRYLKLISPSSTS